MEDANRAFENQGLTHEHDESIVIQGVVHHNNDQDNEQITELNTEHVDTQIPK